MSRGAKKRRAKRHARKASDALKPAPPLADRDAPVDWNRVAARFRSLKGRAINIGYVPVGPRVEARDPEELAVNTAIALAELAQREPRS